MQTSLKEGIGGGRRPKRQGDFKENSRIQKNLTSDLGVFQEEFQTGFNCTLAGCFSFYLFIYFLQVFQLHKYHTTQEKIGNCVVSFF